MPRRSHAIRVGALATALLGSLLIAAPAASAAESAPGAPSAARGPLHCPAITPWDDYDANGTGVTIGGSHPIRHEPTSSCAGHRTLPSGTHFSIHCSHVNEAGNRWYHIAVKISGVTYYGWIYSGNVSVSHHNPATEHCHN
ncbi:hypothetical protein ACFYT4_12200 [Streptomyces sp. NPDC004609]|uniref:hypothetical protein n=1 Tax=Streptomyces sp. NPDC004609 TaxID=3364704 RepID=UPI0036A8C345